MALRMTRPTRRSGSTMLRFTKRVPKHLRDKAQGKPVIIDFPANGSDPAHRVEAHVGKGVVSFSLHTRDPAVARERTGIATAHLEALFAALERGNVSLTAKQAMALAGEWYHQFMAEHEDDPPSIKELAAFAHAYSEEVFSHYDDDEKALRINDLMRLARKQIIAPMALGEPDAESWNKLCRAVLHTIRLGLATLKRRAEWDFGEDGVPATFPPSEVLDALKITDAGTGGFYQGGAKGKGKAQRTKTGLPAPKGITFDEMLSQWWNEAKARGGALSTHEAYQAAFKALVVYLSQDARRKATASDATRLTKAEVDGFKRARLAEGKAYSTVDMQIGGIKAVLSWAVDNDVLPFNAAEGVKLPRNKKPLNQDRGFSDDEAKAILIAASNVKRRKKEPLKDVESKRWLPWLCAYTGARVGEMAQLRKQDIRQLEDGQWIITITPEAHTVKNKEYREVPLHPHMVEQGFMDFVNRSGEGFLFLDVGTKAEDVEVRKAIGLQVERVRRLVHGAIRTNGKAPNHAWRHRLKSVGRECGISEHTLDAICGHRPNTVGGSYGTVSLKVKCEAIAKLPRYEV